MKDLKDIQFEPIDYDKFTDVQWKELARYHNEVQEWFELDLPKKSVEAVKAQYTSKDIQNEPFRIMAMNKDKTKLYAGGGLYRASEKDPNYETNKHVGYVNVTVREPYRRMKLGSNILKHLATKAKEFGLKSIESSVTLETGKQFCESYGAQITGRGFMSQLKADEIDYEMMSQWRKEGQKRAQGVTIERYSRIPDNLLDEFCDLMTEVHEIEADLEGHERETRFALDAESYRHQLSEMEKTGTERVTLISRETDGSISGLTEVGFDRKNEPGRVWQWITGVGRKYQGRGLGKWLKAEMIVYLKEVYPDMKDIRTGNATVNAPMLSINRRMGFKTIQDDITFKIGVDDLLEKLEKRL
jgi:GNAT superfamily N-acetyltransferase